MKVVTVGDNCMDVYKDSGKAYPGGNPVNVAVYLKSLGAEPAYIGWVGTDHYGEEMIKAIQGKGVDTTHLSIKEGKTAVTDVHMEGNDRRFGDYDEGVMSEFALTGEELEFIAAHQLVHAGLWGHAENYFSLFKKKGLLTSFDFSDQLAHKLVQSLLPYVDYPFFSYKENDAFIRQFLKSAVGKGSKIAVATLGEKGSLAYDGRDFYEYGVVDTDVVDTMGAGDSFIAGFTYGILKGLSIESCLELGSKTAANTIRYFGAW